MSRVYNPPEPHVCDLSASGEWKPTDLRRGAVEVCDDCGKAWVYDPIPWERKYRPVRRWPFDRRQRAALKAAPAPHAHRATDPRPTDQIEEGER